MSDMTPEKALMIVDPDTREAALTEAMGCRPLRAERIATACRVLAADYCRVRDELYKVRSEIGCAKREDEKSHDRDGFIRCGYVQFAEAFGECLKPYEGCPRGPEGLEGYTPGQEPGRIAAVIGYLVDAGGNVLVGPDEDYICVPRMWYDRCLTNLREALKGGAAV